MLMGAQSSVQTDGLSFGDTFWNVPSTIPSSELGWLGAKLILPVLSFVFIFCIINNRKGGNSSMKPMASVKNPGVSNRAPAKSIIAPCTRGSVGFLIFWKEPCKFWIVCNPWLRTNQVPATAVKKTIKRVELGFFSSCFNNKHWMTRKKIFLKNLEEQLYETMNIAKAGANISDADKYRCEGLCKLMLK